MRSPLQSTNRLALLAVGVSLATALLPALASAQAKRPPPILAWSAQPAEPTPWQAPNKPHWKLSDVLAKHAGQRSWSEPIVSDTDFTAHYISMAPGEKTQPRFYADDRIFWVVQSGQIRFTIEGQEPFIASKGFLVQVPYRTIFSMETIGTEPSLRFEVVAARAAPLYPVDEKPTALAGKKYVKVSFTGRGAYDEANQPFLDFNKDVVQGGARGGPFVKDDMTFANIIRGNGTPPPPPTNLGHFHVGYSEFWFVLEGKIDYLIEGVPFFTADQGDVVYAPMGRWHRASFGGTGPATRLAINPRPEGMHNYQPPESE